MRKGLVVALGLLAIALYALPAIAANTAWETINMPAAGINTVDGDVGITTGCDWATGPQGRRVPACAPGEGFTFVRPFSPGQTATQQLRFKVTSGSTTATNVNFALDCKGAAYIDTADLTTYPVGAAAQTITDAVDDANPDTMIVTSFSTAIAIYDADGADTCANTGACEGMDILFSCVRSTVSNELPDGGSGEANEKNNLLILSIDRDPLQ